MEKAYMRRIVFTGLLFLVVCNALAQTFRKKYKGTVGNYPVTLTLIASDGKLSGTYYYDRNTEPISVRGIISGKNVEFSGFDLKGNKIDIFIGQYSQFDIHGIWYGEASTDKLPFQLVDTGAQYIMPDYSTTWLLIGSLILASGILVIVMFVRMNRKKKPIRKLIDNIDSLVQEKFSKRDKEYAFEKFITDRLSADSYRLLEWRSEKNYDEQFAANIAKPDLEFEMKTANHENRKFSIECKYRSRFRNDKIDLGKMNRISDYKKYAESKNRPVFLALGIGGKPSGPDIVYIIPVDKIHSTIINFKELTGFKITGSRLNFDPEHKTLN